MLGAGPHRKCDDPQTPKCLPCPAYHDSRFLSDHASFLGPSFCFWLPGHTKFILAPGPLHMTFMPRQSSTPSARLDPPQNVHSSPPSKDYLRPGGATFTLSDTGLVACTSPLQECMFPGPHRPWAWHSMDANKSVGERRAGRGVAQSSRMQAIE